MFYVLVDADVLRKKGVEFFRKTPDGRGIVSGNDLRTLGDFENVDIVSSEEALDAKIEEQNKAKKGGKA